MTDFSQLYLDLESLKSQIGFREAKLDMALAQSAPKPPFSTAADQLKGYFPPPAPFPPTMAALRFSKMISDSKLKASDDVVQAREASRFLKSLQLPKLALPPIPGPRPGVASLLNAPIPMSPAPVIGPPTQTLGMGGLGMTGLEYGLTIGTNLNAQNVRGNFILSAPDPMERARRMLYLARTDREASHEASMYG